MQTCPLCQKDRILFLAEVHQRSYLRCTACHLILLHPRHYLSQLEEKQHYDHHQNDPADQNYRRFLNQLCEPLLTYLKPHSTGLDFGCGPGPTVSVILGEAGHQIDNYDPLYANDRSLLTQQYDVITATEVFEHLHHPHAEITRLVNCLKDDGVLAVMTSHPPATHNIESWHYLIDPTHVCFYSQATFEWIARYWGLSCDFPTADVAILQRL